MSVASVAGCARGASPVVPEGLSGAEINSAPVYRFDSLDGRAVSSEAMRGRVAVLTFMTTDNLASQVEVNYLVNMAKRDGDRVGYALVAVQAKETREMVEIYRSKLGVPFPVALADDDTMNGGGPFGLLEGVPTTIILDAAGRITWRHSGIVKPEQLRDAMVTAIRRGGRD